MCRPKRAYENLYVNSGAYTLKLEDLIAGVDALAGLFLPVFLFSDLLRHAFKSKSVSVGQGVAASAQLLNPIGFLPKGL